MLVWKKKNHVFDTLLILYLVNVKDYPLIETVM